LQDVAQGIAVGAALVTMLYSTNAVLGYVEFRWASLLATNIRFGGMGASKHTLCKQLLDCCNVSSCWVWFFPLGTECWNFVLQSGTVALYIFTAMRISKILVQALGMGFAVALVEEILFRAWLQDEIAVDFGFHKGVFLSALVFSLTHWCAFLTVSSFFLAIEVVSEDVEPNPLGLSFFLIS
jgi:membrane protease YdiL (CAAX protease family)